MITGLDFLILGMATWRISSMLVQEKGPWNIFEKIRKLSGIEHDDNGNALLIPDNFFANVLSCIWCCSVWVAIAFFVCFLIWNNAIIFFAFPFALSSISILLNKLIS